MAEIKSTMDIIMEKLNKMKISEEDREEIIKKEVQDMARRLIVKYMERPSIQNVINKLDSLTDKKKEETKKALIDECIKKIRPYEDNRAIFDLLERLLNRKTDELEKMVTFFEDKLKKEKEKYEKHMLKKLKKRGIYGSAIIPNLEADPEWNKKLEEINKKLHSNLNDLISKLK